MEKRDITICGKAVTIAYCFDTEINFHNKANTSIENFDGNNPEHIQHLIMAAIKAYYEFAGTDAPITENELRFNSEPEEIIDALAAFFDLRALWYKMPKDEPKEVAQGEDGGKNA